MWDGRQIDDTSWEDWGEFQRVYSSYHFEEKVSVDAATSDTGENSAESLEAGVVHGMHGWNEEAVLPAEAEGGDEVAGLRRSSRACRPSIWIGVDYIAQVFYTMHVIRKYFIIEFFNFNFVENA